MSSLAKEEFILRVNQETRYQMDSIIQDLRESSRQFNIGVKTDMISCIVGELGMSSIRSIALI